MTESADRQKEYRWHQIEVLLHEYDTLRTESLHRNILFNAAAAAVATVNIAFIAATISKPQIISISACISTFEGSIIFFLWFRKHKVHNPLVQITARLRDLELIINKLARKKFLIWERHNGFGGLTDVQGDGAREAARKATF